MMPDVGWLDNNHLAVTAMPGVVLLQLPFRPTVPVYDVRCRLTGQHPPSRTTIAVTATVGVVLLLLLLRPTVPVCDLG